jgi:hypothetical protein
MPDSTTQKGIAEQLHGIEVAVADLDRRLSMARDFRVKLANEKIGVVDV